jgi:hypothetical protein
MLLLTIDFTWNNFIWTVFGAVAGLILSHYWAKFSDRNKLFMRIYCHENHSNKCLFLYLTVYNEGNKPLPRLFIKLKGVHPDWKDIYFDSESGIEEIKPTQFQTFSTQLSDSNHKLLEPWEKLINKGSYDIGLYVKISKENSSVPVLYSNRYAVRILAQILYCTEKNTGDGLDSWEFLKERDKKIYINRIESKFGILANPLFKILLWDKFPSHYKLNSYRAKRKRL